MFSEGRPAATPAAHRRIGRGPLAPIHLRRPRQPEDAETATCIDNRRNEILGLRRRGLKAGGAPSLRRTGFGLKFPDNHEYAAKIIEFGRSGRSTSAFSARKSVSPFSLPFAPNRELSGAEPGACLPYRGIDRRIPKFPGRARWPSHNENTVWSAICLTRLSPRPTGPNPKPLRPLRIRDFRLGGRHGYSGKPACFRSSISSSTVSGSPRVIRFTHSRTEKSGSFFSISRLICLALARSPNPT